MNTANACNNVADVVNCQYLFGKEFYPRLIGNTNYDAHKKLNTDQILFLFSMYLNAEHKNDKRLKNSGASLKAIWFFSKPKIKRWLEKGYMKNDAWFYNLFGF